MTFAGLHFLRPLWLLGLLAVPVFVWAWRRRRRRAGAWRDAVDPHLLPHLLEGGGSRAFGAGHWLAMCAIALASLAMAGPTWRQVDQPLWQTRAPLVIALDLSSAATASDLPPSRLAQARAKIAQLLRERRGGQVALVAYAEDAYTVAPLTDDVANIALFLDALDPDVMPEDGSRAGRAIDWSRRLLRQGGFDHGDILLLAADADRDARAAARAASADGFRVSLLGLGTAAGAAYRKPDGSLARSALDASALQAVAGAGDGRYAALQSGNADLEALGVLDPASAGARASQGERGATWQDDGFWLLPPLLLLAALGFRRGGAFALLALCLWLPLPPAHAQDGGLWRRADQRAHQRMQQGERAYRKGDFKEAGEAFAAAGGGADADYNLGNALAKEGRYEEAIAAYDRALRRRPDMPDAVANRKAVEAAMRRKPPEGANRKQPGQNQNQGQSQSKPGEQDGAGDQADPSQAGQPPSGQRPKGEQDPDQAQGRERNPSSAQQKPPQAEGDPDRQREADDAQRQRMRQALQRQQRGRQGDQRPDEAAADATENEAQRERRLANEAWLRRVPDDPGALLRAKFQLEYERRQAQGGDR